MVRAIKASSQKGNKKFIAEPSYQNYEDVEDLLTFTPDNVVEMLQQIQELRGLKIFYELSSAGKMALYVGDNIYTISKDE